MMICGLYVENKYSNVNKSKKIRMGWSSGTKV